MFSKACEYGIRATIFIAGQSDLGRKVSLKEIAESTGSPEAYTSKILQQLIRNNIINSDKGPGGGFSMDQQRLKYVKLANIVFAIDGDRIYNGCALGLKKCNDAIPCPLHDQFKVIRKDLKQMLETTAVQFLSEGFKAGVTYLKR